MLPTKSLTTFPTNHQRNALPHSRTLSLPSSSSSSSLLCCLLLVLLLCLQQPHLVQAQETICGSMGTSVSECRSNEWFDADTGCCQRCTDCSTSNGQTERFEQRSCNRTHNAVCGCNSPTFLDSLTNECLLNCQNCPSGDCLRHGVCRCARQECHSTDDFFCRRNLCVSEQPVPQGTTEPVIRFNDGSSGAGEFPAWGIGLIAVGIVIGIIIFASCFLCLGLFNVLSSKSRDPESQHSSSETSENGLVPDSFVSVGTNSTYASSNLYPYLSSQGMLEILRQSNSQLVLGGSSSSTMSKDCKGTGSSLHGSPVSIRSSPKPLPGRTVKLAKSADSDKLTAIML